VGVDDRRWGDEETKERQESGSLTTASSESDNHIPKQAVKSPGILGLNCC